MPCWFSSQHGSRRSPRGGMPRRPRRLVSHELVIPGSSRKAASARSQRTGNGVHRLRKLDVLRRDATGIVGCEHDLYCLVNVAPFGVMVVLFSHQSDAGHEAEGFVEILENIGSAGRLLPADLG